MTITLSQFNRNPSYATRAAMEQDVIVTERGKPRFRLTVLDSNQDVVERTIREGRTKPAPARLTHSYIDPLPKRRPGSVDSTAELEADRGGLNG